MYIRVEKHRNYYLILFTAQDLETFSCIEVSSTRSVSRVQMQHLFNVPESVPVQLQALMK
jgi:hypothetical protein